MNAYIRIVLLLIIDLLSFKLAGFWLGIVATCIVVYRILSILGVLGSIVIYKNCFKDGISYTKDYIGPYYKQRNAFLEAVKLIETFKLKDFFVIAIYHDSPNTVEKSKLRSSIGLYRVNSMKNEDVPEDFEKFCEKNGYNKNELPKTESLYGHWNFSNFIAMIMGIIKFYKYLHQKGNYYKVDETKMKVCVEIYESDNSMSFYVPLEGEKFMIFKKDK